MSKEQIIDLILLLSALESWSFSALRRLFHHNDQKLDNEIEVPE